MEPSLEPRSEDIPSSLSSPQEKDKNPSLFSIPVSKTSTVYEDTKSSTNILISRGRVAGTELKGILGSCWFGRNFLTGCIDHLLILIPHLLIFSIKGLAKLRAKRNEHSPLMDLPRDIILDVLTRLPVKSLSEICCISKTSLNIIDNPFFATLHTSRLLNSAVNSTTAGEVQLMLLAHSWSSRDDKFLTALQSLKYNDKNGLTKSRRCKTNILSRVGDYEVDFVFCNLICLQQKRALFKAPCLLINPLRGGEFLELPINDLIPPYARKLYGIGFDSITSTHKIVCVFESVLDKYQKAYVYTLGTRSSSWREIHSVPQRELSRKNVSAYGDMHWLIYKDVDGRNPNRFISFDSKKDEFVWTPYPNSSQGFIRGLEVMHLLNLRGCLTIVSSGNLFIEIWVLKNYEKKEWALDYKIDNEMLPRGSPLKSIESCGELENGIFFTDTYPLMFYFWDIRYKSIKYIRGDTLFPDMFSYDNLYYRLWGRRRWQPRLSIFSCTRGLISLKTYGNLVERRVCRWKFFEAAKTRTWDFD